MADIEKNYDTADKGIAKDHGTTVVTRGSTDPADVEIKANEDLHRGE
jgi:hypothetical protein